MTCSSCSQPLDENARFCSFCGHDVRSAQIEERRVVTVLFADLVGYTALSEYLDPERVKRLVEGAFFQMIEQVERFGGRVDKVLGDGLLVLFGAPVAHEDDPDRAVRAAIEMHAALDAFISRQADIEQLQLRIGVNTGEVVVGTLSGTDDYTAMGDVVNVASRLQTMAPPGGVYIGASTEAQLSPSIERVRVADTEVRGREQSEEIWRITGRVNAFLPGRSRHDQPFVGRTSQRDLFASIMGLVSGGRGAVVSVSGEPGSGKTRMVNESLSRFPGRGVVIFSGACAPYGETNVWAPIADALFKQMGADRDAPATMLREIVESKGLELYGFDVGDPRLQRFVEGVMHLFGHPSELDRIAAAQARELLMQMVIEGVHRRSQNAPVVVWIDDLQWADRLLLELLTRLSRSLADQPVLVVTAQRDDAEIEWPPVSDHPVTIRMPLDALTRKESHALVASVLGDDSDPALVEQLYERSGGNPFFLTQLAQIARDSPGDEALPGSLRALIAARLDGVTTAQRQVVENAAVLGSSGPVGALEQFAGALGQVFDPDDLDVLADQGLFDIEGHWWRFRSDVVREVAYQTLTKSARAERHAGTAAFMQQFAQPPLDQVAHHAAAAAELVLEIGEVDNVPSDIGVQAVDLLAQAARRSLDVGAFSQAVKQATQALSLAADNRRSELLLTRATALSERREGSLADVDAREVLQVATAEGDVRSEAIARRLIGIVAQQRGELGTAREEMTKSVELLRDADDPHELATSLSDRGFVEVFGGSLEDAERILAEAEELANELEDLRRLAWIRQHQAWVAFLSGDTALAEQRLTTSSGLFEDLGDRTGTGWAMGLLAYVRFFERRFEDAEELAWSVRKEAVDLGELWAPAMMDSLMASIRLWTGRFSEAEELSRRALTGFRALNDRFGIVQALAPRMRSLVALGRNQEAERTLEEALSMADAFGDLAIPTMAAAGTAAHLGLGARAVALGETALTRMSAMHADGSEARITLALGLCQVGDADAALANLVEVGRVGPYSRAVTAVASVMAGMIDDGIAAADEVLIDDTATYLDRVLAGIALGAALAGTDPDAAALRLVDARRVARSAGDAVAIALSTSASQALIPDFEIDRVEHLGDGWKRVIGGLTLTAEAVARP